MKKFSIGSWAFLFNQEQPTNDFHSLVHKLGHLGYAGVELLGHTPHPTPDSHDTKEKRQKLRKMVVDHRLDFSGYAPLMWTEKLWSVEDHRPFVALFEKNAIFAEDLGIKTIRIDTVEPVASAIGFDPKLLFDRVVLAFDACSKIAANHGVTIAWEFEPRFALNKPDEVVAVVDAVRASGNGNFGVLFDTWNAHVATAGKPLELLQRLKGKIAHLHLSDSDGTVNEYNGPIHMTLGGGVLNFDQMMPELLTCGVPNDWWCVDLCFWPDAWTATAESKRFLDKIRHKHVRA